MISSIREWWSRADHEARITYLVILLALATLIVHATALQTVPDDAFISFRYAQNLARGLGPVFNPGQPVEGYTSPLWVFILGGLGALGLPIPETAIAICFATALTTILLLPRFTKSLGLKLYGLEALLLALNTSYAVWAGSAMEMVPFGLLLIVVTQAFLSEKTPPLTGLLFALLTLLRPEGVLFAGLALLFSTVPVLRREDGAWRRLLWMGAAFSIPVGIHLAWRLLFYGYPLPNTFYAKVGWNVNQWARGLGYVGDAAIQYLLALTVPLLLGVLQPFGRKWAYVTSSLSIYFLYLSTVGGDFMVSFRLLTPVLPLAVVLAAHGLVGTWRRLRPRLGTRQAVAAAVLGLLIPLSASVWTSFAVDPEQALVRDARPIADWLNHHCPAGRKLAVYAAGALPYYAIDFEIVDMFGLNEVEIARIDQPQLGGGYAGHEKYDTELVLKREPDMFIFQPELGDRPIIDPGEWREGGRGHLVRQFTDDIDFWADHSTQTAPLPDGRHFNFVIRNPYFCQ